jgi:hypothetical protein
LIVGLFTDSPFLGRIMEQEIQELKDEIRWLKSQVALVTESLLDLRKEIWVSTEKACQELRKSRATIERWRNSRMALGDHYKLDGEHRYLYNLPRVKKLFEGGA